MISCKLLKLFHSLSLSLVYCGTKNHRIKSYFCFVIRSNEAQFTLLLHEVSHNVLYILLFLIHSF